VQSYFQHVSALVTVTWRVCQDVRVFDQPYRALASWTESGGDLRAQLEANAAECARLAETLRNRTTHLERESAARLEAMVRLERECAARLEVIERLELLRVDSTSRLESREAELAALAARADRLELEMRAREREIERLAAELAEREAQVVAGRARLDVAHSALEEIRSSRSWRLTAPLRWLLAPRRRSSE
jgi:chromosome segregation ATPase